MSNILRVQDYSPAMWLENWHRTSKKKYQVYACIPPLGTEGYNQFEDVHYKTNENTPIVLSGTKGEQWCIDFSKFLRTYQLPNGQPLTLEYLKSKGDAYKVDWFKVETCSGAVTNWGLFVPKDVVLSVSTSWGFNLIANRDGVPHGEGDYLVCSDNCGTPNLEDMWVVNGEIFPTTYDMRGFARIATALKSETPIPKSLF